MQLVNLTMSRRADVVDMLNLGLHTYSTYIQSQLQAGLCWPCISVIMSRNRQDVELLILFDHWSVVQEFIFSIGNSQIFCFLMASVSAVQCHVPVFIHHIKYFRIQSDETLSMLFYNTLSKKETHETKIDLFPSVAPVLMNFFQSLCVFLSKEKKNPNFILN